jgi:hypothetical protein
MKGKRQKMFAAAVMSAAYAVLPFTAMANTYCVSLSKRIASAIPFIRLEGQRKHRWLPADA